MQCTCQGFRQGSSTKGSLGGQLIEVVTHDAFGHQQVFGVSSVEKEQIFTEAVLTALTIETLETGSRICHHNRITFLTLCDFHASFCDNTGNFMSKTRWCLTKK